MTEDRYPAKAFPENCHPERSAAREPALSEVEGKDLRLPNSGAGASPLNPETFEVKSTDLSVPPAAEETTGALAPEGISTTPVISTGGPQGRSGETTVFPSESPHASTRKPRLLPWLTYLLLMPLIALATTGFGCISLIAGLWDKSGRQQHAIAHAWARVLLVFSLSPVTLEGAEKLHLHETAVYVANHLSYYDTPVLFAKLPFQFRILAKQSLWKIPFIGWYLHRSGQVPVDQTSARSAIASLNRGVATLKSGLPLVIFPEGGRTPTGNTQSFVSGAAYMAIKAQVPIVPITLVGTYELLPIHTYHLTPRPLKIIIGDPLPTTGLTTRDADTLTQRVQSIITETYISEQRTGNREQKNI
ncbi:MAG TPA: lysophospholipid acyltransferase family protein [Edaphobacter sp.]|nr:lysophospholipid acyltransferase family protein [Edaphobacter sp.]